LAFYRPSRLHRSSSPVPPPTLSLSFFFNVTATPDIYTLSLHDALPISRARYPGGVLIDLPHHAGAERVAATRKALDAGAPAVFEDRKSTRLNSSHGSISYAVFCLKKKKKNRETQARTEEQNTSRGTTGE